jgi:hypothetical protein
VKQLRTVASDYAVAGILMYLHNSDPDSATHSYSIDTLSESLSSYVDSGFTPDRTEKFVRVIERMGIGEFFEDPFADPIFQISDSRILGFFTSRANTSDIFARAWNLDLPWLKSAFAKGEFWEQVDQEEDEMTALLPIEAGQVHFQSNSDAFKEASELVDELLQKLEHSNDVGRLKPEELEQAQFEVAKIKEGLEAESVESPAYFKVTRATLVWIAKQAAGAVVGALALTALVAIFNIPLVSF